VPHTPATLIGERLGRLRAFSGVLWRWEAQLKGVQFRGTAEIIGRPLVSVAKGGSVIIGPGVRLYSATRANPLGLARPCVLRALAPGAQLILGPRVGLSGTAICAGIRVEIGEGTILGAGAMVVDNDFHARSGEWDWVNDWQTGARPVKIGRGVFVGAQAIILKGVTIGDRAIIGAGAVVTTDVPAGALASGNPAGLRR
jgi:acetyltransferase-like isoleucine patch superfamily enzyme